MRKKFVFLIILLLPIISGCNYKELNNLSIINAMSIDYIDNKYTVTVQVLNTDKSDEQNTTFDSLTYTAKGKNLTEAISNISLTIPKKIYLGHLELLVISKSLINKMNDITNYFINNDEVSKNFTVLLSLEDNASSILKAKELISSYPYGNIIGSIENSSNLSGISSDIKFIDLVSSLNTKYKTPVMGTIKLNDKKLTIDNLAIIKNNEIVSLLDNKYNLGYNFMTDNIVEAIINYKCNSNTYSGSKITNTNTIIKPSIKNNELFIKIYITGDVYILENSCHNNNEEIKKSTSKKVKSIITDVLEYSKNDISVDIFNIEELYYKFENKYYKNNNFNDKYKNLSYQIITRLEMR